MPVTTWSFGSGYEGWTFIDDSTANASATRSYVTGAIRTNLQYDSVPGVRSSIGLHYSPTLLAAIQNGDTIELDYGSSSDGKIVRIYLTAVYTDSTSEQATVVNVGSATLLLTLTQNKTLDFIEINYQIGTPVFPDSRNTNRDILEVRLTTATAVTPTPGKLRTPKAFIDEAGDGGGVPGGAGGGAGGNLAAISADGENIYIAAFNNLGFPELIKMAAALDADGAVVFSPGDGGRIGVQTGEQNAETVWVGGSFGGTDVVERSEDAGASFTVKDDGTFGTVRTFQIGPNSDDRILVFDGDNGVILESLDDGATWTIINAAVTPLVNSIARSGVNPEEVAAGNQGDATDSINYSPNTGVNLEDYQIAPYPNVDATKVIII